MVDLEFALNLKGLVHEMNVHAMELEDRGERHMYGPAIQRMALMKQAIEELREQLDYMIERENYEEM